MEYPLAVIWPVVELALDYVDGCCVCSRERERERERERGGERERERHGCTQFARRENLAAASRLHPLSAGFQTAAAAAAIVQST